MKNFLLALFVSGITIVCKPQSTAPVGFGNTYTYSEADGIDESNFVVSGISNSGKVFFHANFGSLFIRGNNYTHKIIFPPAVQPRHIVSVLEKGNNQYIIAGDLYYYFIENDTLTKFRRAPADGYLTWLKIAKEIIAINGPNLYSLEKDSLVLKLTVPESIGLESPFYYDRNIDLWIVRREKQRFDFSKINNLWKTEFQFSLYLPEMPSNVYAFTLEKPMSLNLICIRDFEHLNSSLVRASFDRQPSPAKFSFSYLSFQQSILKNLNDTTKEKLNILYKDKLMNYNFFDSNTHSFYFATTNKPFRYFPYLKTYPKIFNHTSSSAIFAITQDSSGKIWVASYEGGLSVIGKKHLEEYYQDGLTSFLPGSFSSRNHVYLNSEQLKYGLVQYDMKGHKKSLIHDVVGFYEYMSKNKRDFYFGTYTYNGLWKTDIQSLESGNPKWRKIDSTYGNYLRDIESITEDSKGRIWMGSPDRGFAIYYPEKNKSSTWLISSQKNSVDFWSSCTDEKGTVWLGTGKHGLMFYNDYKDDTIDINKILKIEHPLLQEKTRILQLKIWTKWLVIGTQTSILLFDLDRWYTTKKIFIRYLNPQEGNFTASPAQNTMLVNQRDSTVWFATNDMLYQWDIKEWLSLPTYVVKPNLVIHTNNGDSTIREDELIKVKPTKNSLKFSVWFQSPDNMPRYMSVALIKKGDSLLLPHPSLQTEFEYSNLAPGNYEVLIQICQSDGSVSVHKYPFLIKKFWWQYWWVWVIFFSLLFIPVTLWIQSRNKARLVEEKAKRRDAEQQKKLSALQIVSLGNQFRPHFILNALNTVGAELDNKPQAESVLSRLGESVDIIFSHTQKQKVAHSLADEWRLVKNIIDIHQMMYLKKLETDISDQNVIDRFDKILIPLGLAQIPVENALLHGLSNRETGPWKLVINVEETQHEVVITITDNGVGRLKAATLSNFRKHGVGSKNLNSILEIVNAGKTEKITLSYVDGIFRAGNEYYGTKVIITIPKNFQYEIG